EVDTELDVEVEEREPGARGELDRLSVDGERRVERPEREQPRDADREDRDPPSLERTMTQERHDHDERDDRREVDRPECGFGDLWQHQILFSTSRATWVLPFGTQISRGAYIEPISSGGTTRTDTASALNSSRHIEAA